MAAHPRVTATASRGQGSLIRLVLYRRVLQTPLASLYLENVCRDLSHVATKCVMHALEGDWLITCARRNAKSGKVSRMYPGLVRRAELAAMLHMRTSLCARLMIAIVAFMCMCSHHGGMKARMGFRH